MKKKFGNQNSGESRQLATNRLKKKLIWKIIYNRTNLINIASGSNTCPVPVFLFSPLVVLKLDMNVYTYCNKVKCWKLAVWRIRHSCNTSWSVLPFTFFFVFGDWIFLWRPFCHLKSPKGDFLKKWAWSAARWTIRLRIVICLLKTNESSAKMKCVPKLIFGWFVMLTKQLQTNLST